MSSSTPESMQRADQRFLDATPRSKALAGRAREHLPNGVSRSGLVFSHYPLFIERAKGQFLYDVDGRAILDFALAFSALPLGHANPKVLEAMRAQLDKGLAYGLMHESEVELAALLHERVPSMERVRFTSSGTEATMFAVRLARAFTGRTRFARMEGSYHGTHDMMCSGMGASAARAQPGTEDNPVSMGIPRWTADEVEFLPFNDLEGCVLAIEAHASELAAVITEPLLGAGGAIPPEPGFLEGLREICDRHGILLIFDEMISMGLSPGGAQQYYGVDADLTATGKSAGSGMPMGVFGGRADIMALCEPEDGQPAVLHTGSFNAHPLAMVAGVAQLEQLTPKEYSYLGELGDYLRQRVRDLAARRGVSLCVTGVQHISAFHYTDGPVRNYRDRLRGDADMAWRVGFSLLGQGYHVPGGSRTNLCTEMTQSDIDGFITALETAFEEAGATGRSGPAA